MSPHKCKLIYKTLYIVVEKQLHKVRHHNIGKK